MAGGLALGTVQGAVPRASRGAMRYDTAIRPTKAVFACRTAPRDSSASGMRRAVGHQTATGMSATAGAGEDATGHQEEEEEEDREKKCSWGGRNGCEGKEFQLNNFI